MAERVWLSIGGIATVGAAAWCGTFFFHGCGATGEYAPTLERAASLGDALAPIAALATLGALLMALRSVKLQADALSAQRDDLRLQQQQLKLQLQEMQEAREEMKAQRKELARSAEAQQKLIAAQEELTAAQRDGVAVQLRAAVAQHHANIASLHAAIVNLNGYLIDRKHFGGNLVDDARDALIGAKEVLKGALDLEKTEASKAAELLDGFQTKAGAITQGM